MISRTRRQSWISWQVQRPLSWKIRLRRWMPSNWKSLSRKNRSWLFSSVSHVKNSLLDIFALILLKRSSMLNVKQLVAYSKKNYFLKMYFCKDIFYFTCESWYYSQYLKTQFLKYGTPRPLFLIPITMSINTNRNKLRLCAWDLNLWLQDRSRRQNLGAMTAARHK